MTEIGKITSPKTKEYNCIAWATRDILRFWWPKGYPPYYWPPGVKAEETVEAFVEAYATCGFEVCRDSRMENGWEKIAIYVDGSNKPKHAARQIDEKVWTSKLGSSYDINHPFIFKWSEIILEIGKKDLSCYGVLAKLLRRRI